VAVDGVDGSGKTPLALGLAERMRASVVSMDDFLNRNRNSYARNLRRHQLRHAIGMRLGLIIVEGVCVRAVLERLHLTAFRHIYVKAMTEQGTWSDESDCELTEHIEGFLERERETLRLLEATLTPFREEVIRYHAAFRPSRNADYVFLRKPVMPNNSLQRTRRRRRSAKAGRSAATLGLARKVLLE
jgi:hypothetical protein